MTGTTRTTGSGTVRLASRHPGTRALVLLACVVLSCAALLAFPARALADRSYEIVGVDIDATVTADGTLHVVETRTFAFDGSFNGVYWIIPTGYNSSNGQDVKVSVVSAGEGTASGLSPFTESAAGLAGTYEVSAQGADATQVKLYAPHEDETVSFTLAYDATGIVTRWEDTAELYWKFVSDGWDEESTNVTCRLHLPVPDGEAVTAGENVRAWGHGPLDASVAFDGNEVVYTVPGVGTEEFAEMRVAFPTSWVAGLAETAGEELPTILSEEQQWADEANAQREQARLVYVGSIVVAAALAVLSVALAVTRRLKYRRDFAPHFTDTYFRDVPTKDHPAVLGALANGGTADPKELTATLMRLTDQGLIRLDKVTVREKGLFREKTSEDYRVTKLGDAPDWGVLEDPVSAAAAKIDHKTLSFLFDQVAGGEKDTAPELCFSELERFAKKHPQRYSDAYDAWKTTVEGAYLTRFTGTGLKGYGKGLLIALAVADFVAAFVMFLVLFVMEASLLVTLGVLAALIVAGVVALLSALSMKDVNRDAIETKAQLEALKRWLCEFTRLKEAVPQDVVLWNRLLVMAVVLGVADEVIEQLKVAVPEVVDDPYFMPTYGWYFWAGHGMRSPAEVFEQSVSAAHDVSTAALAESHDSSGGGFGGGFSGGGGGGFGGGGGGGAF